MAASSKRLVYCAGPLTTGDRALNLRRAIAAGDMIYAMGGVPLIPHLAMLWEEKSPRNYSYEEWMEIDFAYIERCDAIYRIPGESPGSDREVEHATRLGLPVFGQASEVELAAFLEDGT